MSTPRLWCREWILLVLLLVFYWSSALSNLTALPLVYEDEPWAASTGWKLATQGVFGSDMFAGLHNMDQRYYDYLPLYSFVLAFWFRFAGLGLEQLRLTGVVCGLLILALTFSLARRLWHDARVGLAAIAILLLVRGFALSPLMPTGILFADAVRVARYDVLVPVAGLLALHAYLTAAATGKLYWYLAAGVLCALAGLAHVYGAFFIVVVLALLVWERPKGWGRASAALCLGFALPWALYSIYVLQDVATWRAQLRGYGDRFGVTDWRWYVENIRTELQRYSVGITQEGEWMRRPGFWLALFGLVAAVFALGRRAFSGDSNARVVLLPLVLIPVLFACLIRPKFTNYLFVVAPFAALALGWLLVMFWDRLGATPHRRWLRGIVVALALVIAAEGAIQYAAREMRAQVTTPYEVFLARVRAAIPPHTRVLGLPNYGLGWLDYDYRSLAIPFELSNADLEPQPLTLEQAMDYLKPDYILLDGRMRQFLGTTDPAIRNTFESWLERKGAIEIARVEDASYGLMEIFRVRE